MYQAPVFAFISLLALACTKPNPAALDSDDEAEALGGEITAADDFGDPESVGSDLPNEDSDTTLDESGDMDGESSGGPSGESEDTSESDTSTNESDTGELDTSEDEGEPVCELLEGVTEACNTCVSLNCCDTLAACVDDLDCSCLVTCLLSGDSQTSCGLLCEGGLELPSLVGLLDCVAFDCPAAC